VPIEEEEESLIRKLCSRTGRDVTAAQI